MAINGWTAAQKTAFMEGGGGLFIVVRHQYFKSSTIESPITTLGVCSEDDIVEVEFEKSVGSNGVLGIGSVNPAVTRIKMKTSKFKELLAARTTTAGYISFDIFATLPTDANRTSIANKLYVCQAIVNMSTVENEGLFTSFDCYDFLGHPTLNKSFTSLGQDELGCANEEDVQGVVESLRAFKNVTPSNIPSSSRTTWAPYFEGGTERGFISGVNVTFNELLHWGVGNGTPIPGLFTENYEELNTDAYPLAVKRTSSTLWRGDISNSGHFGSLGLCIPPASPTICDCISIMSARAYGNAIVTYKTDSYDTLFPTLKYCGCSRVPQSTLDSSGTHNSLTMHTLTDYAQKKSSNNLQDEYDLIADITSDDWFTFKHFDPDISGVGKLGKVFYNYTNASNATGYVYSSIGSTDAQKKKNNLAYSGLNFESGRIHPKNAAQNTANPKHTETLAECKEAFKNVANSMFGYGVIGQEAVCSFEITAKGQPWIEPQDIIKMTDDISTSTPFVLYSVPTVVKHTFNGTWSTTLSQSAPDNDNGSTTASQTQLAQSAATFQNIVNADYFASQTALADTQASANAAAAAASAAQSSADAAAEAAGRAEGKADEAIAEAEGAAAAADAAQTSAGQAQTSAGQAQTAADNAVASAATAGRAAADAQAAQSAAEEAQTKRIGEYAYSEVSQWLTVGTVHTYSKQDGWYNGALTTSDIALIYVILDNGMRARLLLGVNTAVSQGWSSVSTTVLSYSDTMNAHFWTDDNGAHVQGSAANDTRQGRIDVYGDGLNMKVGTTDLAHFGYGQTKGETAMLDAPYYDMGLRKSNTTKGAYSMAEGYRTVSSDFASHAEGANTTAMGFTSHAEGNGTTSSGSASHAEGYETTASGSASHAEGDTTTASGNYSHAEGYHTAASGNYSHAEGYRTTASRDHQHVQGQFNVVDSNNTYADIVGCGADNANRKNIEATTWTGDKRLKGDVYVGCNDDSTGGYKLPRIYTETLSVSIAANSTSGSATVSFPSGMFSAAPFVMLSFAGAYTRYAGATCTTGSLSASSVAVHVYHTNSSTSARSFSVRVLAIEN